MKLTRRESEIDLRATAGSWWKEPLNSCTRGQFVAELMKLWEDSIQKLTRDGHTRAAEEVRTALRVLEKTYTGSELRGNNEIISA